VLTHVNLLFFVCIGPELHAQSPARCVSAGVFFAFSISLLKSFISRGFRVMIPRVLAGGAPLADFVGMGRSQLGLLFSELLFALRESHVFSL
jgi:hypothetical protein